ncbi:LytR/AlgR family response regulator transcription factor [Chondrinema litorale]|uniref:LytR/AlgR family response regulator transcription factor n=1 Tax=Chondrinema litorale TaxID=2994555 RepID=UPI002542E9DD|nr:LytTR family DNA-binding domain-containing protein [Chondrinema litorale]UZR96368.1 LytTR family DNA-binding domain-containing protein [Chondrinema litorale]
MSFSWSNYWWIINRTFVLGSIPFSFFILIDYKRRDVINKELALNMLNEKTETKQTPKIGIHSIVTDLKNEIFTFEDRDFSYAVAEGNYTDFYFSGKGELNSVTYRISLSSFEKQINSSNLQRCHRSYLVNLDKVINISGNAQGLKLTLDDNTSEIPVSRKYISMIKASLLKKF